MDWTFKIETQTFGDLKFILWALIIYLCIYLAVSCLKKIERQIEGKKSDESLGLCL